MSSHSNKCQREENKLKGNEWFVLKEQTKTDNYFFLSLSHETTNTEKIVFVCLLTGTVALLRWEANGPDLVIHAGEVHAHNVDIIKNFTATCKTCVTLNFISLFKVMPSHQLSSSLTWQMSTKHRVNNKYLHQIAKNG